MSKTALVTGGGRGIGRAIVERFFEEDWTVFIHYNRSEESARQVADNGNSELVQADLTDEQGIRDLIDFIEDHEPDVLVNNAGIVDGLDPADLDLDSIGTTFRINTSVPILLCRAAAEEMASGGSIINLSSIRGLQYASRPGITTYCASKSALMNATSALAQHYAPDVRINGVAPGFTDTDMTSGLDQETRQEVENKTPMGRFGFPGEIAEVVCFLGSDRCDFLTGETIVVDGGYSIAD